MNIQGYSRCTSAVLVIFLQIVSLVKRRGGPQLLVSNEMAHGGSSRLSQAET